MLPVVVGFVSCLYEISLFYLFVVLVVFWSVSPLVPAFVLMDGCTVCLLVCSIFRLFVCGGFSFLLKRMAYTYPFPHSAEPYAPALPAYSYLS